MDTNTPQSVKHSLPSIQELFSESWLAFKHTALRVFLLYIITFGVSFAIIIGLLIIGGSTLLAGGALQNFDWTQMIPLLFGGGFVLAIVAIVAFIIVGTFMQVGLVLSIYNYKNMPTFGEIYKKNFKLIIPLLLLGIVTGFLILGSFFLFILPAIVFSLFFTFAPAALVTKNLSFLQALRRSIYLVKHNFWEVIARLVIWTAITIIATMVLSYAENAGSESLAAIAAILNFFLSIFLSWFGAVYGIILYKQVDAATPQEKYSPVRWFTIVAIAGWAIAVLIGIAVGNLVATGVVQKAIQEAMMENYQEDFPMDQNMTDEELMQQYMQYYNETMPEGSGYSEEAVQQEIEKYLQELETITPAVNQTAPSTGTMTR